MAEVERYAKELMNISFLVKEFNENINRAYDESSEWGIEEMSKSFLSIFNRFCPYKVNDRIQLSKNVDIDSSSNWITAKHFLIQGSKGYIESRGYRNGKFSFDIIFDDESHIDKNGDEQPMSTKHTYSLDESYLIRCN